MARQRKLAADLVKIGDRWFCKRDRTGRLVTSEGLAGARLFDAGSPAASEEASRIQADGRSASVLTLTGVALDAAVRARKKCETYLVKLTCPGDGCGWIARATAKHIEKGLPTCACGSTWEAAETEEGPTDA